MFPEFQIPRDMEGKVKNPSSWLFRFCIGLVADLGARPSYGVAFG